MSPKTLSTETTTVAHLAVIDRFVTGSWQPAGGDGLNDMGDGEDGEDEGGFEDLETGEVVGRIATEGEDDANPSAARMAQKLAKKAEFDNSYDERGGGGEGNAEADADADADADVTAEGEGASGGGTVTSTLKPGQELFAEDPFILQACGAPPAAQLRHFTFAMIPSPCSTDTELNIWPPLRSLAPRKGSLIAAVACSNPCR